jgi:hypothetical protein
MNGSLDSFGEDPPGFGYGGCFNGDLLSKVIYFAADGNRWIWLAFSAAYRQGEVVWKSKRRKEATLKSSACAAG